MSNLTNIIFFLIILIFSSFTLEHKLKSKTSAPYHIVCTPATGFTQYCSNHRFDPNNPDADHYMVDCTPSGGALTTYTISLNNIFSNNYGSIFWGQGSSGFGATCVPCGFSSPWNSTLNCQCKDGNGNIINASIDLNQYLGSNNGALPHAGSCQNVLG